MSKTWRRTLTLPNLPKKLVSRRNLHAYFSKFGEVQGANVNKDNRSGVVVFATRAEAKAAKNLGKVYDDKPLRILWFENSLESSENLLDPRAKQNEEVTDVDNLWVDDDKECFGVEVKPAAAVKNQSATGMIKRHLKWPEVKKRLVNSLLNTSGVSKSDDSESDKSTLEVKKPQPRVAMKKMLASKRKLSRKEGLIPDGRNKMDTVVNDMSNTTSLVSEPVDLKQKLFLLDERDKLIRQKTVQDSNFKTAVAIKGTCPDMCPERERILRQCGHQIAVYESYPGTNKMDENRAIKEYIRSSADQEVPLPHDLRPAPVLSMTMSYLITNIINKIDDPEENKAVWYSFCWNRLRSIRKDIILQQLCDLETVAIVEQCARFHICCYDHMWGLDGGGFSDKINTNNLIDCLQTLKHLYEDLAKRNIKCPNEPEFHAYLILLKLTTGDVFWEYQQYPSDIQFSSKVQFAIAVYMAFINNMYSKYFSLVKQASYLEACLLQRYFDEVRTKALKMMLKAYSLPNRSVCMTTSFLVNCLKFDTRKNVVRFCEKIESHLDKKIEFDEFDIEEDLVSTSSYLIKEKRLPIANAVVGENNHIPVYVPHQVHTSFDEEGQLQESLQPASDECNESYDSPLDASDISVPDIKTSAESQNKPFKFSLSPKIAQETVFSNSIFSRLGPLNTSNNEFSNKVFSETDSTKLQSSTFKPNAVQTKSDHEIDKSFYEDEQSESTYMEDDMDVEIVSDNYEDKKTKEDSTKKPLYFTEFRTESKSIFGNQQLFSNTPTVSEISDSKNMPYFLPNKHQPSGIFAKTSTSPQLIKEADVNKQDGPVRKFPIENPFSFTTMSDQKSPCANKSICQQNPAQVECPVDKMAQHKIFKNKSDAVSEVKESNVLPSGRYLEKNKEKEMEALKKEQEILKKKQLDEERIKREEAQKKEIERRKELEKKKAIEKLRKDLRERMKAKNAKKYIRLWKTRIEKLKEKRADFPMLQQLSVENHLRLWGGMKYIPSASVLQRAKDKQHLDNIVSKLLKYGINDTCKYIGRELAELLVKSAAMTMDMGSLRPIFWKVAISLPWKDQFNPQNAIFNQMMRRCCRQTFYGKKDVELGSVESVITSHQIPVHVSVHVSDDLQSCRDLHGMDALIFVVADGLESEESCLKRLRCSVSGRTRNSDLAVSVMTISGNKFDRVLETKLKELHEQNCVGYSMINEWTTPYCLLNNLKFLTEHIRIVQNICTRSLESLIRDSTDDFIYEVKRSQVYCPLLCDALENPNTVIHLYNTFLTKLEDLLLSSKLEKYFNFAEDFKSHIPLSDFGGPEQICGVQYSSRYHSDISNTINALKLPDLQGWPVHTNEIDFDKLAELVESYCRTEIEDMEVLKLTIRKLAQEVYDPSSFLNSYSWLHIVEMWAESRLSQVFCEGHKRKETRVIYNKEDLHQMIKKQWWIELPIVAKAGN